MPACAFDVQGHRGARGLLPENTMAGFRKAIELGVSTLETDVAVTRDDVVVISHDPDLNPAIVRGSNGLWLAQRGPPIRWLDFAQLVQYDIGRIDPKSGYARGFPLQSARDGERIARLDDVLALAKQAGVRVNIETKITPESADRTPEPQVFARLVVDRIDAAGMHARVTIQSFDWRTLVAVKQIAPRIATVCLTSETDSLDTVRADASGRSPWHAGFSLGDFDGSLPRLMRAVGCDTWSPNAASATRERIAQAHSAGLAVVPWTVNETATMTRLIDLGVDGLISDYPDRLIDVVKGKRRSVQ
jgi:glycerophosphoryl diester phosphodiesterase